jgi:hypothetical protein
MTFPSTTVISVVHFQRFIASAQPLIKTHSVTIFIYNLLLWGGISKIFPIHRSSIKALSGKPDTRSAELEVSDTEALASNASQVERVTNVSSCDTHSTVPKKVSVLADSLKLMWGQPVR